MIIHFILWFGFIIFLNVYLVLREMGVEQREKERERIPSRLHAVSAEPNVGLYPRSREIKSQMLN